MHGGTHHSIGRPRRPTRRRGKRRARWTLARRWLYSRASRTRARSVGARHHPGGFMADWDVIAKQRLTEDWATLRAGYLPLNQAMRRTVEFLEKSDGTFASLLSVARERLDGTLKGLTALCTRRSP